MGNKRLILLDHAIRRIKHGDEHGRRTQLKTMQVLDIIGDPRLYVPYRGKVSDGRVFFSVVDQKCLVAWIEECDTHYKVHTVENHHNLIPLPVLLRAEQKVLGDMGFMRRFTKPPADPSSDAICRISSGDLTLTLSGYLHQGISWWRSATNVRQLLGFIQKHDLDGTESLILNGHVWHGRKERIVEWSERFPLTLPRTLYQAGNQPGTTPDFATITAQVLENNAERRKLCLVKDNYVGARAKRK